ncbi:IS200/IS605 family transposase [Paucibacter soli]|uniref:IS200/IS605 family transposase n=1 Tax=Paucibacter soli TaxID=3133433 RepID=UPI003097724C
MNQQPHRSSSHAVFQIRLHIVLVTKYRRKTLSPELIDYLRQAFGEVLADWRCELLEFGGEADQAHLLADIHPALNISTLINNLKTASARRCGARFREHLAGFYKKLAFWHRAYFASRVGGVTLDVVKQYVRTRGRRTSQAVDPSPWRLSQGARASPARPLLAIRLTPWGNPPGCQLA